ncbi:MAG: hypothetical protein KDA24_09515 [Deltaproteobacteria bacterium]|nr:hypothetical protein [Deltaproteobacteria bacterium]
MERPHQRPRFRFLVHRDRAEVTSLLEQGLTMDGTPCVGSVSQAHAWIHVRAEARHFWSPTLDLMLEETEADEPEQGTWLRGRFAPHPSVWSMFMFIYAVLGLLATLAAMYGFAQITLAEPPWAFGGTAAGVALIGFVYGATFIGQGLGAEQMTEIRLFLDRTVGPGPEAVQSPQPDQ